MLITDAALSTTAIAMSCAGAAVLAVAAFRARGPMARAHGIDKFVALVSLCFATPLAVFGALHLFGSRFVIDLVPAFVPWRAFWVIAVGVALLAAALSLATGVAVRWSGLLFGVMMFAFVALIHLPGALASPHDRIAWTIVARESSFGGAAWLLAAVTFGGSGGRFATILRAVGRVAVTIALIAFGVQHLLYPTLLPGVPMQLELPVWLPGRTVIDYLTGVALLLAGGSALLGRRVRTVASLVGAWLLLLVVAIYLPFLVVSLASPVEADQIQGINYFADTLLFAAVILALANAAPAHPAPETP